jgi:hypothetical protein
MTFNEGLTLYVNGVYREDREWYKCILNVVTQQREIFCRPPVPSTRPESVLPPPASSSIDVRIGEWSRGETDTTVTSVENTVIPF